MDKTTKGVVVYQNGSCAIQLPDLAVDRLGLREGEQVSLRIEGGGLLTAAPEKRYTLDSLLREARGLTPPDPLDDSPWGTNSCEQRSSTLGTRADTMDGL